MNLANRQLSKQRLRLWLRMLGAQRDIETHLREQMRRRHDSTLPRFDVMSALDRFRDGLRMSDLSAKLRVSNGNVTGIVERLVSEGLVERIAVDGDRRAMCVRLTPAGIARFTEMAAEHETWIDEKLSAFSAAELNTLIKLLDRIGDHPE